MRRRFIGWRREDGEVWETIMRRMRDGMHAANQVWYSVPWSERCIREKWRLASHIARSEKNSWSKSMVLYTAATINDEQSPFIPHRYPGRPHTRWDDQLRLFCRDAFPEYDHWTTMLQNIDTKFHEEVFLWYCIELE